jgi:hypothetical protein
MPRVPALVARERELATLLARDACEGNGGLMRRRGGPSSNLRGRSSRRSSGCPSAIREVGRSKKWPVIGDYWLKYRKGDERI